MTQPVVNPAAGRFRYDPDGTIFYWSDGTNGKGYAVCLRCGRAASERGLASVADAPAELTDHLRLRGGSTETGEQLCPGNHEGGYALRRNLWLGGVETTDVVEFQFSSPPLGVCPTHIPAGRGLLGTEVVCPKFLPPSSSMTRVESRSTNAYAWKCVGYHATAPDRAVALASTRSTNARRPRLSASSAVCGSI